MWPNWLSCALLEPKRACEAAGIWSGGNCRDVGAGKGEGGTGPVLGRSVNPTQPDSTAIPYRESTGFLQGFPCVVFPPLHALAVYRV